MRDPNTVRREEEEVQKHALLLGGEQGNTGSDLKSQQWRHRDVSWVHRMSDRTTKNHLTTRTCGQ